LQSPFTSELPARCAHTPQHLLLMQRNFIIDKYFSNFAENFVFSCKFRSNFKNYSTVFCSR
jgi:hypothetical protein